MNFFKCTIFKLLLVCLVMTTDARPFDAPWPADLYALDKKIRQGDKRALLQLSACLEDTSAVTDHLGYHIISTTKGEVAMRLFNENTFFLDTELNRNSPFTAQLKSKYGDIYFDRDIGGFLITALGDRSENYKLSYVPDARMKQLRNQHDSLVLDKWQDNAAFRKAFVAHDPSVFVIIAQELLRKRHRYNEYDFDADRYADAIALLSGIMLGVEDEYGDITFNLKKDFSKDLRLHYAVYWLSHYKDYQWNRETGIFENRSEPITVFSNAYEWYMALADTNGVIAVDAFVHLTESDPDTVARLNREFRGRQNNYLIRNRYDRFLSQLSELTRYCRTHHIDYKGRPVLQSAIKALLSDSGYSFASEYRRENEILEKLTWEDVTALEYWSAVYDDWGLNSSSGRILDKFYSANWRHLVKDTAMLALLFKKISLIR